MMRQAIILGACLGLQILVSCHQARPEKPNVLFIAVDDLRPELGCYGNDLIKTPSLDRLASEGCVFTHHFVAVPTCGASRYGLLTGLRPRNRIEITNEALRRVLSGKPETESPETFIHHLRRNGYFTVGIGKIGHYPDGLLYGYEDAPGTERALKSALIVKTPGMRDRGYARDQIVSTLDIYPTLMDLCGLEMPHKTDGHSLSGLLMGKDDREWENPAYSYFRSGISIRTEQYRLTKYFRTEEPKIELYDHTSDPFENHNVAGEFPEVVARLMIKLEMGNTGLYTK